MAPATRKCSAGTEPSSIYHGKEAQEAVFLLHVRSTVLYTTKIMQLLYSAPAPCVRAQLMPHVTILNSHFLGLNANTAKHVKK